MNDPRWTDEIERQVANALCTTPFGPCAAAGEHLVEAERVLVALADAGLLIEPGSDTREEWGIEEFRPILERRRVIPMPSEVAARVDLDSTDEQYRRERDPKTVRRTVHTGPWRGAS